MDDEPADGEEIVFGELEVDPTVPPPPPPAEARAERLHDIHKGARRLAIRVGRRVGFRRLVHEIRQQIPTGDVTAEAAIRCGVKEGLRWNRARTVADRTVGDTLPVDASAAPSVDDEPASTDMHAN